MYPSRAAAAGTAWLCLCAVQVTPNVAIFRAILHAYREVDDPVAGVLQLQSFAVSSATGQDSLWMLYRGPLGCQIVEAYIDGGMVCSLIVLGVVIDVLSMTMMMMATRMATMTVMGCKHDVIGLRVLPPNPSHPCVETA